MVKVGETLSILPNNTLRYKCKAQISTRYTTQKQIVNSKRNKKIELLTCNTDKLTQYLFNPNSENNINDKSFATNVQNGRSIITNHPNQSMTIAISLQGKNDVQRYEIFQENENYDDNSMTTEKTQEKDPNRYVCPFNNKQLN